MTLDTRFYVLDEVDPAEIFRKCQELLTTHDEQHREPIAQVSYNKADSWPVGTTAWTMGNRIDQGLPALLEISYRPGKPYRTAEQAAEHDDCDDFNEPGDPPCAKTEHDQPCWLEVSFDTASGYRHTDNGMGCGDLHALLVAALAGWCTERNLRWKWRNEFTSEIHDDLESLVGLLSGGFEAQAWFQNTVMPAIASGLIGGEL